MVSRLALWVACGLTAGAAMAACSADGGNDPDDDGAVVSSSSAQSSGQGGQGGQLGLGGSFGAGGGNTSASGCSADLQSTVDADGNTVAQCEPDKGCFEGACINACEAAANSKGSIGCEYWTPTPPFLQNENATSTFSGSCYAVFVANTWGRHAQLSVKYNGQSYDVSGFARIPSGVGTSAQYAPLPAQGLPPNEVAVLFMSHEADAAHPIGGSLACPVPPAIALDTTVHNSGRGPAFEVVSDTPITAYDIMPYGGAESYLPSASLLVPRTAWGDNYVAYGPHFSSAQGPLWLNMVGSVDGTTVDIVPNATLPGGGGAPNAVGGQLTSFTIDAGEVVQWLNGDPTGAVIQASQPVGIFTGNTYLRVSSATSPSGGAQDSAHQQLPPISALGATYVAGNIVTRRGDLLPESVPYRIVGVVDGTSLSWSPAPPSGAPSSLAAGQVVEFESNGFFEVGSQDADHPFAMSQYMPGTNANLNRDGCTSNPSCRLGDEEWVVMIPPEQFLQRYVFFTDPTYGTTNLVMTRVAGANGFTDVTLDCLGVVSGWQDVGSSGKYQVAHVALIRGGVGVQPACATSRHEATSDGRFGIMVWGTDYYASYGYPAGGNVGAINSVVVIPTPE